MDDLKMIRPNDLEQIKYSKLHPPPMTTNMKGKKVADYVPPKLMIQRLDMVDAGNINIVSVTSSSIVKKKNKKFFDLLPSSSNSKVGRRTKGSANKDWDTENDRYSINKGRRSRYKYDLIRERDEVEQANKSKSNGTNMHDHTPQIP
ncbi:DNA repair protein [Dirofilaria immitis]